MLIGAPWPMMLGAKISRKPATQFVVLAVRQAGTIVSASRSFSVAVHGGSLTTTSPTSVTHLLVGWIGGVAGTGTVETFLIASSDQPFVGVVASHVPAQE